jgi:hypothetical protein
MWIGYRMESGQVKDANGNALGAYNSSSRPYLHFIDYTTSTTETCATTHGRSMYYQYKWW